MDISDEEDEIFVPGIHCSLKEDKSEFFPNKGTKKNSLNISTNNKRKLLFNEKKRKKKPIAGANIISEDENSENEIPSLEPINNNENSTSKDKTYSFKPKLNFNEDSTSKDKTYSFKPKLNFNEDSTSKDKIPILNFEIEENDKYDKLSQNISEKVTNSSDYLKNLQNELNKNNEGYKEEVKEFKYAGETVLVKKKVKNKNDKFERKDRLGNLLDQINNKTNITSVEKSRLDWQNDKLQTGDSHELEQYIKNGFVVQSNFLASVEEKSQNTNRMIRRNKMFKRLSKTTV